MSIDIDTSVWIDRTPGEVFAALTDVSKFSTYVPGVVQARFQTDERGVGTRIGVDIAVMGTQQTIVAEWTRYEPGQSLASKNVKGMKAENIWTLKAENGGTRLERSLHLEPAGVFETLATPLIRSITRRNAIAEAETFKELVEAA